MNRFAAFLCICIAVLLADPARAALSEPNKVYQDLSAPEFIGIMSELGLTFSVVETFSDGDIGLSANTGSGSINALLGACSAGRCSVLVMFAVADAKGVSLQVVNTFNRDAVAGRAVLLDAQTVGIAYEDVFGGVTRSHIALNLPLFATIIDRYFRTVAASGRSASLDVPSTAFAVDAGVSPPALNMSTEAAAWMKTLPKLTPPKP